MKKITLQITMLVLLLLNLSKSQAQVVSFNTQAMGTGYSGNNGSSGISFVIQNTNTYPAVLTSVSNYFAAGGTAGFTLWYSSTSLSGGPIVLSSPTWSVAASVSGVTVGTGVQTSLFPLLSFTIPASTTYRFYVEETGTTGPTFTYTGLTNPTGASPLTFTNTGVSLIVGESLIAGQFVGWGGLINNPRAFTGSVTLNLLSSPCTGFPNAGTATALPANPCPGIPVTLALTGVTSASGLAFQWQRASSPTGPWTTAGLTTATTNPSLYTPVPGSTTWYRCIVTCTNSGLNDTSNVTGAVVVQNWSATGPCWCTPTYVNGGTQDHIINVTLGTLTNNTAAAGNPSPYFVNYTPLQTGPTPTLATPSLTPGISANLLVSYGTDPNQYGAVWIDFNHNGAFDTYEYFSTNTNAGASGTHTIPITAPYSSVPGVTRMRIRAGDDVQMTSAQACGPTNSTWGETEDYLVNILPTGPYDPSVSNAVFPIGNLCPDSNQTLSVQVCNYGTSPINCAIHPVYVSFQVNGPTGLVTYTDTINTGLLPATGIGCQTASVNANLFLGGTYIMNAYVSCPTLSNSTLANDSLSSATTITNYRPTAGAPYNLCQYNNIPFGQGLTVGGCSAPLYDSVTINFTILGPCNDGNNDASSCQFATGIRPALIPGSTITGGVLTITNLATVSSSWMSEMRFNIYGTAPTGVNIFSPGVIAPGAASATTSNYTYTRPISSGQLSNLFTVVPTGDPVNLGYWESLNDVPASSDISINAGGSPTVATLKIYYSYVPPSFAWYDVPTGGTSLYSLSPFNPLLFPNAVVNNSNVAGDYSFYAACLGLPSCRVPVHLIINPTPSACQDSMFACEYAPGANNGIFNLTTMDSFVSCFNAAASVEYYADEALITPIPNPTNDTSSTNYIYSKVFYPSTGCYSSDTLYLEVESIPQFSLPVYTGFACAPNSIDISSLISVFPTSGNDTLFYDDIGLTQPYTGNPHSISAADTIYMVVVTNNSVACKDSSTAFIDVLPATNKIANQDPAGFSICGSVGCGNITLSEGNTETLYTTADCRRVATVKDSVDGINLGVTTICEDIDCSVQFHNGQPFANRHYEINPTNNGKAMVCLYYLDQDFDDFNAAAFPAWPILDSSTICITQVDNGDIMTPGHTAISIPNIDLKISHDTTIGVWSVCFPVDSFSYFYCSTCNPGNIPLPVTLTSFTGKRVGAISSLNWNTSNEINNHHFVVERSKDAKNFTPISSPILSKAVGGNSSSSLDYSYNDEIPMNGHNYYRLQQVDIDGHITHSGTVDIYFGNETLVTMYPNPVNSELNIEINSPKATVAHVKIMDATGRTVKTVEMELQAGVNVNKVDVQHLADGIYMVNITNNKGLNYAQTIRKK